jgi:hypothetical protein
LKDRSLAGCEVAGVGALPQNGPPADYALRRRVRR